LLVTLPWPDDMMSIVPAATARSCSVSTAHMGLRALATSSARVRRSIHRRSSRGHHSLCLH
jgi:hypothetical protein